MTDRPLATVANDDGTYVVQFERLLAHPRQKVWRAITESEHLAHWMPCDIVGERREGADVQLPFWPEHVERYGITTPVLDGRITVWDPPAVFEWWWSTDRLRWELEDHAEGTRLRFTTWLSDAGYGPAGTAAGYHVCLDRLDALLDGSEQDDLDAYDARSGALEERYAELVTAAG